MLQKTNPSIGGTVVPALVLLVLASVMALGSSSRASGGVCGDWAVDSGEQCDDGNLVNGDGCSAKCTKEQCGNGVIDPGEQCDDGSRNGGQGDQCSSQCLVRFCGDGIVDAGLSEECDDGNGVSGDGCSSRCVSEGVKQSSLSSSVSEASVASSIAASESPVTDEVRAVVPPVPPVPTAEQVAAAQAQTATDFIMGTTGEDYRQYFTSDETVKLQDILRKLSSVQRLTPEEKVQAGDIAVKLEQSKVVERERYVSLLKEFIGTPVSSLIVQEQQLSTDRLTTSEIRMSIDELSKSVTMLSPEERVTQVVGDIKKLKRQGIDLEEQVGTDIAAYLGADSKPIQVFATVKAAKEAAEQYATKNLPVSLETLGIEVRSLQQALPALMREYGVQGADLEKALSSVAAALENATPEDTERVVNAVDHLFTIIERKKEVTRADILSVGQRKNIAAETQRIVAEAELGPKITADLGGTKNVLADIAARAPEQVKQPFIDGSLEQQRSALVRFLETDPRLTGIRTELLASGNRDIENRYQSLLAQISRIGTVTQPETTTCDDSVSDALQCTHAFLAVAEDAARSKSALSRMIGTLQDSFGIGQ